MCVFIKLHTTAQSGLVILVILCHSRRSSQGGISDTCVCVCVCVYLLACRERIRCPSSSDHNYLVFSHKPMAPTAHYPNVFQASPSAQSRSVRESLGRSNQRGSGTSQASYSHPRCDLNLAHLYRPTILLQNFGHFYSSLTQAP